MVGKPEAIPGPDLFGGQVVDFFSYCYGLSGTDPQPSFAALDPALTETLVLRLFFGCHVAPAASRC